ncbi:hypothetical protein AXG93_2145s1500 [Marchantia polymorpha subsp. ruderalis]|uniref:Uncharacterized protein n=1 Tax=Marchantia polymorpha subsp. ruderalis TaxID=1480154 RepID=A0A176VZZ9_MARPO|nr:hypothetical protein AXG93_2145s1500 [Marchantia polymorpha subsp. ruderalis]
MRTKRGPPEQTHEIRVRVRVRLLPPGTAHKDEKPGLYRWLVWALRYRKLIRPLSAAFTKIKPCSKCKGLALRQLRETRSTCVPGKGESGGNELGFDKGTTTLREQRHFCTILQRHSRLSAYTSSPGISGIDSGLATSLNTAFGSGFDINGARIGGGRKIQAQQHGELWIATIRRHRLLLVRLQPLGRSRRKHSDAWKPWQACTAAAACDRPSGGTEHTSRLLQWPLQRELGFTLSSAQHGSEIKIQQHTKGDIQDIRHTRRTCNQ